MKHNWEYKKLGEVCEIEFGTRIVAKTTEPGPYYVYGGGGATFKTKDFNREDCTIISRFAMSPECVREVKGKFYLNDSGLSVKSIDNRLNQCFVDKFLWCNQDKIYQLGRGAAQKNLNIKAFSQFLIPIPIEEIQEHIVNELDEINEMIEGRKEQIKLLDQLAQSIFYEMFGDPITNPKGWEIKSLKNLTLEKLSYGSGASGIPFDGLIRYIRITDIDDKGLLKEEIASSPSEYDSKYDLISGDLLLARSGATVGKSFLYDEIIGKAIYAGYLIRVRPNPEIILPLFIYQFTKTQYYWDYIKNSIRGAAQPNINAQLYGALKVFIPPISLQNEFASRIEMIEEQKKDIECSIKELETLLASRMDYWFN